MSKTTARLLTLAAAVGLVMMLTALWMVPEAEMAFTAKLAITGAVVMAGAFFTAMVKDEFS